MAYYKIEPWGDDWQQSSLLVSTMCNIHTKSKYFEDEFIPHRNDDGSGLFRFRKARLDELNRRKQQQVREKGEV